MTLKLNLSRGAAGRAAMRRALLMVRMRLPGT
jgi:hypothetical protein